MRAVDSEADFHLGRVLMVVADIEPGDCCDALAEAFAFYNARHPDEKVEKDPDYTLRLVYDSPLKRALAAAIRKGEA